MTAAKSSRDGRQWSAPSHRRHGLRFGKLLRAFETLRRVMVMYRSYDWYESTTSIGQAWRALQGRSETRAVGPARPPKAPPARRIGVKLMKSISISEWRPAERRRRRMVNTASGPQPNCCRLLADNEDTVSICARALTSALDQLGPDSGFEFERFANTFLAAELPGLPLRANIDETVLLVVITEQGEKTRKFFQM